jgi:mono/diheme cytochrome c family protein
MKNKKIMRILRLLALLMFPALMFTSCQVDKNNPGYDYMGTYDMYYTKFYKAYTPNPVLPNGQTIQPAPKGTVARGKMPFPFKGNTIQERVVEQTQAGTVLQNPIKPNDENLAQGKKQFNIFCSDCHGIQGKGDGHLYTAGLFPAKPTSLVDSYVQSKPDGEIYYVISKGSISGLMPGHEIQIKPENRWKIINYLRTLAK